MASDVAQPRLDPFERCLQTLRTSRRGRKISVPTWALVRGVRPDTAVLSHLDAQPEFTLPIWDYVAVMADDERVRDGLERLTQHRAIFDAVATRYDVDAETVAAVWGIESNFGRGQGTFSVLRSLATLSCAGRRQTYFRGELLAALRIVQAGHIPADRFLGSWAGAFGQTQFMPGVFWWRAVDFDGDGRRDLMDNAGDALASTANYLHQAGWRRGVPWGFEVQLPGGDSVPFETLGEGRRIRRSLAEWSRRGVTRIDGTPLVSATADSLLQAGLFLPAGLAGPRFLVTSNFSAVFSYNAAESYTLAIVQLADRLRGGGAFVRAWPTDDLGLSRAERREVQTLLIARGHDIGPVDALLTPRTRSAVQAEQRRIGQPATGRPGQKLLAALRAP
ncbi:MAG: lytic murein transglycosylase [Gemmatimonadaceae bacterium]|nr:lytic murein transglycosylase [Gemmatimonadaceae bacterium]